MSQSATTAHRRRGFTLIELMITIAIAAILAAIAYPSFTRYVYKSRRSDAMRSLSEIQQSAERWRSSNVAYPANLAALNIPATSRDGYYSLAFTPTGTGTTYEITATAISTQANDSLCTFFKISMAATGVTYSSSSTTPTSDPCWAK